MIKTIAIGDVLIGQLGAKKSGFLISAHSGFGMASVRVDMTDRGHYDGANFGYAYYGKRAMTIEGEIIGWDVEDYEDLRMKLMQSLDIKNGLQTVLVKTHTDRAYKTRAIISDTAEAPYEKGKMIRGKFQFTLIGEKPFFESTLQKEEMIKIYTAGGFAVPFAIPFSIALGGDDSTKVLTNDGTARVKPYITIFGAVNSPTIKNVNTDESISIDYNIANASDYITIDVYNRIVMYNDTINITDKFSGDWLSLQEGNNSIRFTAVSSQESASVKFQWNDAFIGI